MQRLLDQLSIEIKYNTLLESDIEGIVRNSRIYFINEGFSVNEKSIKNINVELNDPVREETALNSNIEESKGYLFLKNNISITITKKMINILINATQEYEGFDKYKDYMIHLLDNAPVELKDILNIERIEIRKINSLYIYDIEKIGEYFLETLFNSIIVKNILQIEGNVVFSKSTQTIIGKLLKMNIATEIQVGETQQIKNDKIEAIPVYRLILDIESYWDSELDQYSELKKEMEELNSAISNCYQKCLTETFYERLEQETICDENIFGGVK